MRRNSTSVVGALHPILFFMLVYGISLFLALFVCRTVYNSLNGNVTSISTENKLNLGNTAISITAYK
jgi:hypothetical protein